MAKNLNITLLADRVLAKRNESESVTASGIIIPDAAKEKPILGTVIKVGHRVIEKDILKEGATISFGKFSGQEIELEGELYLILRESEIFTVIKGAKK